MTRSKQVVLATGAIERSLVFRDNDRPGTMLAGAAHDYIRRYGVKAGQRAVVFTSNDTAYRSAIALAGEGVEVSVLDTRAEVSGIMPQLARKEGIEVTLGQAITSTYGKNRIEAVDTMSLSDDGMTVTGSPRRIDCDSKSRVRHELSRHIIRDFNFSV